MRRFPGILGVVGRIVSNRLWGYIKVLLVATDDDFVVV